MSWKIELKIIFFEVLLKTMKYLSLYLELIQLNKVRLTACLLKYWRCVIIIFPANLLIFLLCRSLQVSSDLPINLITLLLFMKWILNYTFLTIVQSHYYKVLAKYWKNLYIFAFLNSLTKTAFCAFYNLV